MLNKLKSKLKALKSKPEEVKEQKPEQETEIPETEALEETGTFMLTTDMLKECEDLKDLLEDV